MSKSKRIEGPFLSKFGTFNPGDAAFAITVSTGRVSVGRVVYVGYIERMDWNYKTRKTEMVKFAQIRRPTQRGQWYNKSTNEAAQYESNNSNIGFRYIDVETITTLQHNRLLPADVSVNQLIEEI